VLRKSKSQLIKFSAACNALVLAAALLLASAGSAGARVDAAKAVRISTDGLATAGAQHATEVEPDAAVSGSTIVSTFQVGRFFDGGAAAIGFATSLNAGRTWRSGLLPALTTSTAPAGEAARATDAAVAFDAIHRRWLVESLTLSEGSTAVVVNSSADGLTWDAPVTAVSLARPQRGGEEGTNLDKSWITCDNRATSPFEGRCYIAYTDFAQPGTASIGVQSTSDGGLTWSSPVFVSVSVSVPGVQPVVRANGELVLVFLDQPGSLFAVRSDDGGATFSKRERIATVRANQRRLVPGLLRVFPLPSVGVDAGGSVYVAWSDCRFRLGCTANDIVVSHSTSSGWSAPRRVLVRGLGPTASHILPGLGVDGTTAGSHTRLALTFYTLRAAACAPARCLLDVRIATSGNAGASWSPAPRLNARAMRFSWLADTSSGHMVGDYFATEFAGNRAVGIFALALAPRNGRLNLAIHAGVRTVRSPLSVAAVRSR
jgi:hypothetical protein